MKDILLIVMSYLFGATFAKVVVQEVEVGSTVILPCPSNDDNHRFQFWQLIGDQVIGPGNEADGSKYKYEVLSGTLHIKSVSTSESGFYRCVSRALSGHAFQTGLVELIVRKGWTEDYETDSETNLVRALVAIFTLVLVAVAGVLMYTCWRKRTNRFRDMSDEESPDEAPAGNSYSIEPLPSRIGQPNSRVKQGVDNPTLEADFPTMYKNVQSASSNL